MIHDTQRAQISQKEDGHNIYAILKTMCPPGYHHISFVHELPQSHNGYIVFMIAYIYIIYICVCVCVCVCVYIYIYVRICLLLFPILTIVPVIKLSLILLLLSPSLTLLIS